MTINKQKTACKIREIVDSVLFAKRMICKGKKIAVKISTITKRKFEIYSDF
jgi:hypothetical protein